MITALLVILIIVLTSFVLILDRRVHFLRLLLEEYENEHSEIEEVLEAIKTEMHNDEIR